MTEEFRPRLSREENDLILKYRRLKLGGITVDLDNIKDKEGVLVIGDLHSPFIKYGYLEFCKEIQKKYNTEKTVFIGDIIDNHYSSYHETDPDGHSAGAELLKSKEEISNWYKSFPKAKVCNGNHDLIASRKSMTAGLSASWIRTIGEVLETPDWEYGEEFIINDVMYTHGTGRKARNRAQKDLISVVQGHYHSESYIENFVGERFKIFAMQLGCGIDRRSYGMAYGKRFNKPHINCGIILDNGTLPIIEMMKL
ncbi:metallophosphoesterase [Candidatus Bathyarchaeota archaeon]|nr:metallophosphoesterase [Candidatus Bathyarchaeota archaeon]